MEDSIWKIWRDMVCLRRPYRFKFFKGFLPQVLLGPFLNTLSQIFCWPAWFKWAKLVKKNHEQNKASPSSKSLLFKNIQTWQLRIKILLKQFFMLWKAYFRLIYLFSNILFNPKKTEELIWKYYLLCGLFFTRYDSKVVLPGKRYTPIVGAFVGVPF